MQVVTPYCREGGGDGSCDSDNCSGDGGGDGWVDQDRARLLKAHNFVLSSFFLREIS